MGGTNATEFCPVDGCDNETASRHVTALGLGYADENQVQVKVHTGKLCYSIWYKQFYLFELALCLLI